MPSSTFCEFSLQIYKTLINNFSKVEFEVYPLLQDQSVCIWVTHRYKHMDTQAHIGSIFQDLSVQNWIFKFFFAGGQSANNIKYIFCVMANTVYA